MQYSNGIETKTGKEEGFFCNGRTNQTFHPKGRLAKYLHYFCTLLQRIDTDLP